MSAAPAPLWNKSMARYLSGSSAPESAAPPLDDATLLALGLKAPPQDPRLLAAFLQTEDAADGAIDADGFARGIRRAVRIQLALDAKLHHGSGLRWKQWVESNFRLGYASLNRYQVAARLQIGLIQRKLPRLENEFQSRVLAPFLRHEKFWATVSTLGSVLPPAKELQVRLPVLLGLASSAERMTARLRLHRLLLKIVHSLPEPEDAVVGRALSLLRQAIAELEKGGVT